jgi:hypothetical protein
MVSADCHVTESLSVFAGVPPSSASASRTR